ncbi:MAG: hypothetical protein V4581_19385 [Bacteroidota bacterium]
MKFFLPVLISFLAAALGIFFIFKGIDKHFLSNCPVYSTNSNISQNYINLITSLCESGFTKVIGTLEIISGLLLIYPKTRLIGTFIIMPIIINIFLIHALIDYRIHELLESGIPLAATLLIFAFHQKDWKLIIAR